MRAIWLQKKHLVGTTKECTINGTKSATVKDVDPSMGIQLTNQTGNFDAGDLIVNRTQFDYIPENTVSNIGSTQEYTIAR